MDYTTEITNLAGEWRGRIKNINLYGRETGKTGGKK